jgi:hypothetical protein
MDIRLSQHEKRIIKLGKGLLCKKIGKKANPENIHKYLISTKCKALKKVVELLNFIADNTKSNHQAMYMREYGEFALYICCNHNEYRKILESLLSHFSKFDNVKIDLEKQLGKVDLFIIESALKYSINRIAVRPTYTQILSESYTTCNEFARYMMANLDEALHNVKYDYLLKVAKSFMWIATWIAVNDTAYRHQFYYALNELGNNDIKKIAKQFLLPPEKWFINVFSDGKVETRKLWDENKIPRHKTSILEEPCVPENQQNMIKKHIKKYGGAE